VDISFLPNSTPLCSKNVEIYRNEFIANLIRSVLSQARMLT